MPMCGERSRDNDHFIQGPQSLMTGLPSWYYFLIDAVRIADYLATRADIRAADGFGVTGVSGGGFATLFMALADDRVRAIAPVCCVCSLAVTCLTVCIPAARRITSRARRPLGSICTIGWRWLRRRPCLVMAGRDDDLFRPDGVQRATTEAQRAYELEAAADRFDLYVEPCEHHYTAGMAARASQWFAAGGRRSPTDGVRRSQSLSPAELDCNTAERTASMLQMNRRRAERLAAERKPRVDDDTIRRVLRLGHSRLSISIESVPSSTGWDPRGLTRHVVVTDGETPLPLVEWVADSAPAGTLLCLGDDGALATLCQNGGLGMLRRQMLAADLRGFGELQPEPSGYDLYSWCAIDRALGDLLLLSGETALGQQTRDALRLIDAALQLGARPENLTVYGRGAAAWPAAFAALLHPAAQRVVLDGGLASWECLAAIARPVWLRHLYVPHALEAFDLPEALQLRTDKRILVINRAMPRARRWTRRRSTGCSAAQPTRT